MYPVSAVFTAVSTSPSLPLIAWKRNSVGDSPEKKLLRTKPFDGGFLLFLRKWGRERSWKPFGIRFPEMICCPTHATIWATLMTDPELQSAHIWR